MIKLPSDQTASSMRSFFRWTSKFSVHQGIRMNSRYPGSFPFKVSGSNAQPTIPLTAIILYSLGSAAVPERPQNWPGYHPHYHIAHIDQTSSLGLYSGHITQILIVFQRMYSHVAMIAPHGFLVASVFLGTVEENDLNVQASFEYHLFYGFPPAITPHLSYGANL